MAVMTMRLEKRSLDRPDQVVTFRKTRMEIYRLGERTVMRTTLEPGWRWQEHIRPEVRGDFCEAEHLGYVISGRLGVRMSDGEVLELHAGDLVNVPPGHDAWVIGIEPVVFLDFTAGEAFSKTR